jgi:hypothetical protein
MPRSDWMERPRAAGVSEHRTFGVGGAVLQLLVLQRGDYGYDAPWFPVLFGFLSMAGPPHLESRLNGSSSIFLFFMLDLL